MFSFPGLLPAVATGLTPAPLDVAFPETIGTGVDVDRGPDPPLPAGGKERETGREKGRGIGRETERENETEIGGKKGIGIAVGAHESELG